MNKIEVFYWLSREDLERSSIQFHGDEVGYRLELQNGLLVFWANTRDSKQTAAIPQENLISVEMTVTQ